jgi:hypothetical protein
LRFSNLRAKVTIICELAKYSRQITQDVESHSRFKGTRTASKYRLTAIHITLDPQLPLIAASNNRKNGSTRICVGIIPKTYMRHTVLAAPPATRRMKVRGNKGKKPSKLGERP